MSKNNAVLTLYLSTVAKCFLKVYPEYGVGGFL